MICGRNMIIERIDSSALMGWTFALAGEAGGKAPQNMTAARRHEPM